MTYEQVREALSLIIRQNTRPYISLRDGEYIQPEEVADAILSHPLIAVLSENQAVETTACVTAVNIADAVTATVSEMRRQGFRRIEEFEDHTVEDAEEEWKRDND